MPDHFDAPRGYGDQPGSGRGYMPEPQGYTDPGLGLVPGGPGGAGGPPGPPPYGPGPGPAGGPQGYPDTTGGYPAVPDPGAPQGYPDTGGYPAVPQAYADPDGGAWYGEPGGDGGTGWGGTATDLRHGPDGGQYQAYEGGQYPAYESGQYQAYDTGQHQAFAPGAYAPDPLPGGPPMGPEEFADPGSSAGGVPGHGGGTGTGTGKDDDLDERERVRHRRVQRGHAELDDAPRLPHVPGFEGLRAVALVAVLAFHQGYGLARGGFLGLSSFFTLAGFLLGTLVLAEQSQSGHLSLTRLWERRARRIVPAYVVALALVVVLQFVLRVGTGPTFRIDVLYALGFAENWRLVIAGRDAASIFVSPSPVQHLWSVSLLVQLLVVVPLGFVGLMKLTGRRWRVAGGVVAGTAAVSFLLAKLTAEADGNGGLAYFGTHTRAGELLVGVALAFLVLSGAARQLFESEVGRQVVRVGGPAALLGLAYLWTTTSLDDPALFGGITALNALLTAVVILAVTTSGPATTVLGSWPLSTLGRFAFTAYLVHWPVYLLIDEPRIDLNEHLQFVARVVATLVLAAALHYAVERPWREGLRMERSRVAAAFAGATALVVVAAVVLPQQAPPGVDLSIGNGSGPGQLDVVVPTGNEVARVALVGDSLAASLEPGVSFWNDSRKEEQVRLSTHITEDCPPGAPGPVRVAGQVVGEGADCRGWEPRLPRLLDKADADVVVVVTGLDELGERDLDGAWRHLGDPAYDAWLSTELEGLADTLSDAGVPVVWATIPHVRIGGSDRDWTLHDENDPRRVDRFNDLVRRAADGHDNIHVADLTAWAQDLPRGGEFSPDYRQDGTTFTERGAEVATAWLMNEALVAIDVREPAPAGTDAGGAAAG